MQNQFLITKYTIIQALIKDLERAEVKKWLQQILEILMAERGKEERSEQVAKLEMCIEKHEVHTYAIA